MNHTPQSPAVGEEASILSRTLDERARAQSTSVMLGTMYLLQKLHETASEGREENWDGYGAEPVSPDSVVLARAFIKVLPVFAPPPEIDAGPDGNILFEWRKGPRRVLTVSFSPDGEIHFASLIGRDRIYGTEYFADLIPRRILEELRRVCH